MASAVFAGLTVQRTFDFTIALTATLLLFPILAAIVLAVKMHDGGPVFYRARRVGWHGQLFIVYKFRTMVPDAEDYGVGLTHAGDGRITALGRVLRRWKLDELPQLVNVLKGNMSIVGPRPEDPRYVETYTFRQRRLLDFRPGITSPASLSFRNEESLLAGADPSTVYIWRILPQKLEIDLEYFCRRTTWTDLKIILRTAGAVLG